MLVAELEPSTRKLGSVVSSLRQEIEASPLCRLPTLVGDVLALADRLCWVALKEGDIASFRRHAETASALSEFASSANLLP